jgi:hypothetical protein
MRCWCEKVVDLSDEERMVSECARHELEKKSDFTWKCSCETSVMFGSDFQNSRRDPSGVSRDRGGTRPSFVLGVLAVRVDGVMDV